jgi:hypothetical protein
MSIKVRSRTTADQQSLSINVREGERNRLAAKDNQENQENQYNQENDTISLVIGVSPYEPYYSSQEYRNIFNDPNIFLLADTRFEIEINNDIDRELTIDKSRFFEIDFNNLEQLQIFSETYNNIFDTICFDKSTWKFFNYDETASQRLLYIYNLLKPNGILYIPNVEPSGWVYDDRKRQEQEYRTKTLTLLRQSNLYYIFEDSVNFIDPEILNDIYHRVISSNNKFLDTNIIIIQKIY